MTQNHLHNDHADGDRTPAVGATTEEVARRFTVCTESVRRWARAGRIPAFKAGGHGHQYRFDLEAVEEALRLKGHGDCANG